MPASILPQVTTLSVKYAEEHQSGLREVVAASAEQRAELDGLMSQYARVISKQRARSTHDHAHTALHLAATDTDVRRNDCLLGLRRLIR